MNNINSISKNDNTERTELFECEKAFYDELQEDLYNEYQELKKGDGDPDKIKLILQVIMVSTSRST